MIIIQRGVAQRANLFGRRNRLGGKRGCSGEKGGGEKFLQVPTPTNRQGLLKALAEM
jgi:hypothetical protein